MSVSVTTRQVGDVSVLDVAGRITLGEGSSTAGIIAGRHCGSQREDPA